MIDPKDQRAIDAYSNYTYATQVIQNMGKGDITELKSYNAPPQLVKTVMEAVCILNNETPDWRTSKKMMGDLNFKIDSSSLIYKMSAHRLSER